MELKIKVDKLQKFRWVIELLSGSVSPFNKLRPKEKDVLALLYFKYNELLNIPEEHRDTIIFSSQCKKDICNEIKISNDNLYNIFAELKSKGILEKNFLVRKYIIKDENTLTFRFIENDI